MIFDVERLTVRNYPKKLCSMHAYQVANLPSHPATIYSLNYFSFQSPSTSLFLSNFPARRIRPPSVTTRPAAWISRYYLLYWRKKTKNQVCLYKRYCVLLSFYPIVLLPFVELAASNGKKKIKNKIKRHRGR